MRSRVGHPIMTGANITLVAHSGCLFYGLDSSNVVGAKLFGVLNISWSSSFTEAVTINLLGDLHAVFLQNGNAVGLVIVDFLALGGSSSLAGRQENLLVSIRQLVPDIWRQDDDGR